MNKKGYLAGTDKEGCLIRGINFRELYSHIFSKNPNYYQ